MVGILAAIDAKAKYHDDGIGQREHSKDYWRWNDGGIGCNYPSFIGGLSVGVGLCGNRLSLYSVRRLRSGQFGTDRKREQVAKFSASAGDRMQRFLRSSVANYKTFATLTYPATDGFGVDGRKAKRDLKVMCQRLARLENDGEKHSVFWFQEFQSNGSIHFHLFTTLPYIDRHWLSKSWFEIVGSNLEKHEKAGTNIQKLLKNRFGCLAYARKYAKKECQKTIPDTVSNPGRFWGVYGNRDVQACTVQITDEVRFNVSKARKFIQKIDKVLSKSVLEGKTMEKKVLLKDKNGERTKDIGVTVWDMGSPMTIRQITLLVDEYSRENGGKGCNFGNWFINKRHRQR